MTHLAHTTNKSSGLTAREVSYVEGQSPLFFRSFGKASLDLTPLDGGGSGFSRVSLSEGI